MTTSATAKALLRQKLKRKRQALFFRNPEPDLISHFDDLSQLGIGPSVIAGFAPIHSEINIWPLLKQLSQSEHTVTLPVILGPDVALRFREWTPGCDMAKDRYGVRYPTAGPTRIPELILVPLLAFTAQGARLGYGGGYYDRTLAALRDAGEVFACGVAYAGQEVSEVPTEAHDELLDGVLTETGFTAFR